FTQRRQRSLAGTRARGTRRPVDADAGDPCSRDRGVATQDRVADVARLQPRRRHRRQPGTLPPTGIGTNMNRQQLENLVAEANLAPSVHNTQPTRWRLADDGSVLIFEDTSRRLTIGDPSGRDAAVSHGAAIEGFALAAGVLGQRVIVSRAD